jgi:hypothetical protein
MSISSTLLNTILPENFKEPQLIPIKELIEDYLIEWEYVATVRKDGSDPEIVEGYKYLTAKMLSLGIAEFDKVLDRLKVEVIAKNVVKVKKKRPVDKRKMISKLRFTRMNNEIGLEGIDPIEIFGSKSAWYYHHATRRLTAMFAEPSGALYVQGTSLAGFGENTVSKVLRNPEKQLEQFLDLTKKEVLPWFEGLTTKSKDAKGRIAPDTVLLRVD